MHREAAGASAINRTYFFAAFAAIYFLWGGTYLAIRYSVAEVPPFITIAIRCAGVAIVWFAWLVWRGGLVPVSRVHWRNAAIAGTLLFLGCHGLLAWAEQRVPSGQAALMLAAIPLWLVVLDAWRARQMPSTRVLVGLALGIAGVALLTVGSGSGAHASASASAAASASGGASASADGYGALLDRGVLLLSTLGWAAGSIVARDGEHPDSPLQWSAMQLLAGAIVVGVVAALRGEFSHWQPAQISPRAGGALAFLIIAGTVLGFGAYTWLMQVTSPALVGTYAFVNPMVALILAAIVGDEPLTARKLLAAAIIVGAVSLTSHGAGHNRAKVAPATDAYGNQHNRSAEGIFR